MNHCKHQTLIPNDGICDDCGETTSDIIRELEATLATLKGLIGELLDDKATSIYSSAIESVHPKKPDFEEWEVRARAAMGVEV